MAMIDYGAILRVDKQFINKNKDLFMETNEFGQEVTPVSWIDKYMNEPEYNVAHNYFVCAGDEHFMLCFYKTHVLVVKDREVIDQIWLGTSLKESFTYKGLPRFTLERLEKNNVPLDVFETSGDDKELFIYRYGEKQGLQKFLRYVKKCGRAKRQELKHPSGITNRYKANWTYNGHKYECIYGYGIDPSEYFFNDDILKDNHYGFTTIEIKELLKWFK